MGGDILDLYSKNLLVSTRKAAATGLSELAEGAISHDQIARFLAGEELDGKFLRLKIKRLARQYENREGCLVFDDTTVEKAYMDENEIVRWRYDHGKGRNAKGVNMLLAFHTAENECGKLQTPIDCQIIAKTKTEADAKAGKERRMSGKSKNELMREMINQTIQKHVRFGYIAADSWFASKENMRFIQKKRKVFTFEISGDRLAAAREREGGQGRFAGIDRMEAPDEEPMPVYLKDLRFQAILYKQVFKNRDGPAGVRCLATNDETASGGRFKTPYKKRRSVDAHHESIKQNASIGSSPAHTGRTQGNHIFASIYA
ncbi:MAG: transposase [Treponema sp.]|jgi:hypothetical protein|nr:transposase [Treponema sp.]